MSFAKILFIRTPADLFLCKRGKSRLFNFVSLSFKKPAMNSDVDSEQQFSSGDVDSMDSRFDPPEDYFNAPRMTRRQSTIEDEQRMIILLQEILEDQNKNISNWILENQVKALVFNYKGLLPSHKEGFLKVLATKHSVDHERIYKALNQFKNYEPGSTLLLKAEEQLKSVLTPEYSWLFKIIGRLENGVKFLVDLRTDVLELWGSMSQTDETFVPLQQLNNSLKDLLSMWFSVGFLNLERVTWRSPCEMLQKISEYEAVHPVRSWADLKQRVGPYRRCYVYTHSSMPDEPLVVLHTALALEIASSVKGLIATAQRMSYFLLTPAILPMAFSSGSNQSKVEPGSGSNLLLGNMDYGKEDPNSVKAAVFYSISSTQKGLQGIELGNYLIKRVVQEIQTEFPKTTQFSSLSPIPPFKKWLLDRIKSKEKGGTEGALSLECWNAVLDKFGGSWSEIQKLLAGNLWHTDLETCELMKQPLMTCCAYYLYKEKRRGFALDSVANFHLRNGAVMWRLNWLADTSPRGMSNSCGLMVNYRYFLEDVESNSRNYLVENKIKTSEQILSLLGIGLESKI